MGLFDAAIPAAERIKHQQHCCSGDEGLRQSAGMMHIERPGAGCQKMNMDEVEE